jgi:hypothetical protein
MGKWGPKGCSGLGLLLPLEIHQNPHSQGEAWRDRDLYHLWLFCSCEMLFPMCQLSNGS